MPTQESRRGISPKFGLCDLYSGLDFLFSTIPNADPNSGAMVVSPESLMMLNMVAIPQDVGTNVNMYYFRGPSNHSKWLAVIQ